MKSLSGLKRRETFLQRWCLIDWSCVQPSFREEKSMTKLRWGLLCLALVFVASTYGQQPGRGTQALLSDKEIDDLKLDASVKEKVGKIVKDFGEEQKKVMDSIRGDGGARPDPAK